MHHTLDSVEQTHRLHYATELGWWLCTCTMLKHRGVDSGTLLMACERVSHIQKCTNWVCHKKASKALLIVSRGAASCSAQAGTQSAAGLTFILYHLCVPDFWYPIPQWTR